MANRVPPVHCLDSFDGVMMLGGSGDGSRRGADVKRRASELSASESVRAHSSTDSGLAAFVHRVDRVFTEAFFGSSHTILMVSWGFTHLLSTSCVVC